MPLLYFSKRGVTMRDKQEVEQLYLQHEHLVPATLNKQFTNHHSFAKTHGLDVDDLLQMGRMGLFKAAEDYDASKGAAFKTHAINMIRFTIMEKAKECSLRNQNRQNFKLVQSVSIETPLTMENGEEYSLHDILEAEGNDFMEVELRLSLERLNKLLPERTMNIINMRLDGKSYRQIGEVLNVSAQRIEQIISASKDIIYKNVLA